jgi:hypothetical protein
VAANIASLGIMFLDFMIHFYLFYCCLSQEEICASPVVLNVVLLDFILPAREDHGL